MILLTTTITMAIITKKFLSKNAAEQLSAFQTLLLHIEQQPGVHREAHLQQKKDKTKIPKLFSRIIAMKKVVPYFVPKIGHFLQK